MASESRDRFDLLVVGGGPAGLAAAACAAERGALVAIADDNFRLGGQIWRAGSGGENPEVAPWVARLQQRNVTFFCGTRVFDQPERGVLLAEETDDTRELRYEKLVLATGARERFLPFPGWTLPNVIGAGGLQALVKSGLPISGKRVVVAGTGPLLLAVAACLRKHGANILMICEQASAVSLARFAAALGRYPGKILQALQLKRELAAVPFFTSCWPVAAHGDNALESVRISRGGKLQTMACDYLACGFHLVPNTELASLLDCQMEDGYVSVDELQRTSVPGVFCAGEPTSIGGLELSLVEGQIAGLAASGRAGDAQKLIRQRRKFQRFARAIETTFRLRPELQSLASPETIVCRCEDVPHARLQPYATWRAAKLQTRCGMGPCQARVCGPATQFLFKWSPDSVRPPIFPVRVQSLAVMAGFSEPIHQEISGGH